MVNPVLLLLIAPVVVGVAVACLRRPMQVGLPLYAALIPFGGRLALGDSKFTSLSSLVGIVLGAGLVMQMMSSRRLGLRFSATIAVWLMFLGWAGITALWSIAPESTISGFAILGGLVLIYVFVAMSPIDRATLRRTENALLLGGAAVTCYGLVQVFFLGGFPSDNPGEGPSPNGRFGNDLLGPNNEAIALLLPMLIALTRAVRGRSTGQRFLMGALTVLLITGIVMTGSRGRLLAAAAAVVALTLASPGERKTLSAFGLVGAALAAYVFLAHPFGLAERTFTSVTSSSGRTDIWRVGLSACPRYCPAGSGWETFPDVYSAQQASVANAKVLGGGGRYQAHNLWLLVAIELGLPGLILFASALLLTFSEALRLRPDLRGPPMAGFVGTMAGAWFLSNLEFKFFWMALIYVVMAQNLTHVEARSLPGVRAAVTPSRA